MLKTTFFRIFFFFKKKKDSIIWNEVTSSRKYIKVELKWCTRNGRKVYCWTNF